jgi:hypothetical protein
VTDSLASEFLVPVEFSNTVHSPPLIAFSNPSTRSKAVHTFAHTKMISARRRTENPLEGGAHIHTYRNDERSKADRKPAQRWHTALHKDITNNYVTHRIHAKERHTSTMKNTSNFSFVRSIRTINKTFLNKTRTDASKSAAESGPSWIGGIAEPLLNTLFLALLDFMRGASPSLGFRHQDLYNDAPCV